MLIVEKYRVVQVENGTGAVIVCPTCQELLGIFFHKIDVDGKVQPSVVDSHNVGREDLMCPCGFHDFITLKNFPNPPIKLEL